MDIKLYCPDCGEKLTLHYLHSLEPEIIESHIVLGCTGRCLDDWRRDNNGDSIVFGIPKYRHSAASINDHIADRSDNGRSLPWLEEEHKTCQDAMIKTIRDLSKYLHKNGNRDYGQQPVEIENTLVNIMALNAAAGMDKSYVTGFLDAMAMMK